MKHTFLIALLAGLAQPPTACHRSSPSGDDDADTGGNTDTDSDSGGDSDADTDTDSDTDSDIDTTSDTEYETEDDTDLPDGWTTCEEVTLESHYCLTRIETCVAFVGLETGNLCCVVETDAPLSGFHSVVWLGDYAYSGHGGAEDKLIRISLEDGSWDSAPVACGALAAWNDGLLIMLSWSDPEDLNTMFYCESFEDALDDNCVQYNLPADGPRMTVRDNLLFEAWHATDVIYTYTLPYGIEQPSINLEDYDTWINGLSVTTDGLLVLNAHWPEGRIAVFDAGGGALWNVYPDSMGDIIWGVDCVANP